MMKFKSVFRFIGFYWMFFLGAGCLFVLGIRGCIGDKMFEDNAVIASVTVDSYERKSLRARRANEVVSIGYYYVDGWRYSCYYEGVKPIGAKFRIKYNRLDPKRWRSVDE